MLWLRGLRLSGPNFVAALPRLSGLERHGPPGAYLLAGCYILLAGLDRGLVSTAGVGVRAVSVDHWVVGADDSRLAWVAP